MADTDTTYLTFETAKRVVNATRQVESEGLAPGTATPNFSSPSTAWYAQITAESTTTPGTYQWKLQQVVAGVLADAVPAYNVSSYSAAELNGTTGVPAGTNVYMFFAGYDTAAPPNPRYLFVWSHSVMPVELSYHSGQQGNADTGQECTFTYDCMDPSTRHVYATQVPLFGHRPLAQLTNEATIGLLIWVSDSTQIGFGGAADVAINGGNGMGYLPNGSGSGSGSGSGPAQPNLHLRLMAIDESFPTASCEETGSGSGSGSGE